MALNTLSMISVRNLRNNLLMAKTARKQHKERPQKKTVRIRNRDEQ